MLKQIFLKKEFNISVQNVNYTVFHYYNVKLMDNCCIMLFLHNIFKECIIKGLIKEKNKIYLVKNFMQMILKLKMQL